MVNCAGGFFIHTFSSVKLNMRQRYTQLQADRVASVLLGAAGLFLVPVVCLFVSFSVKRILGNGLKDSRETFSCVARVEEGKVKAKLGAYAVDALTLVAHFLLFGN